MAKKPKNKGKQTTNEPKVDALVAAIEKQAAEKPIHGYGGRPTKYTPAICQRLMDYFLQHKPYSRISTMFGPKEDPFDLPTLAGFAVLIGVHRDTLHEWENAKNKAGKLLHPEFSDAIKKAKTIQEHYLVTNSLRGNYDRTFAIFFAKNVLGWRDVRENIVSTPPTYGDLKEKAAKSAEEARRLAEEQEDDDRDED